MNLFVLTPEEKRVVAFIMLTIVVGVAVKEYRKRHPVPPVSAEEQKHPWMRRLPPLPSVTPTASASDHPRRSRKPRRKPPAITPIPSSDEPDQNDM